jgi:hypothetical protein
MKTTLIAAFVAAFALPVLAQTSAPAATARLETGPAKVQSADAKAKGGAKLTTKERAKLAKGQKKPVKKAKQKPDAQKAA